MAIVQNSGRSRHWHVSVLRAGFCVLALAPCVLEVDALSAVNTNRKCFTKPPGSADRKSVTVKLGVRSWLSHQLSSAVLEIVLKEYMGYDLIAYDLSSSDAKDWGKDLSSNQYDIDVESLEVNVAGDYYKKYMVTDKTVVDAGSPGYSFRKGLYTTPEVLKTHPFAPYYLFYRNITAVKAANFVLFGQDGLKASAAAAWPVCDATKYSWCGTGALEGFWSPPACTTKPEDCVVAFMNSPGDGVDTAHFEQLTANYKLNLIHGYAGNALGPKVKALAALGKQVVFFSSETDPLPAQLKARRLAFPDFVAGCDAGSTKMPSGPLACDYGDKTLTKLVSSRLRTVAPEAYYLMDKYEMIISDLQSMIGRTIAASGPLTPYQAACEWIKGRNSIVVKWIPACIWNPPKVPKTGDFLFDPFEMKCKEVIQFPGSGITTCYNATGCVRGINYAEECKKYNKATAQYATCRKCQTAQEQYPSEIRPGNVDRSKFAFSLCYQSWLSQQLSSAVGGILLRDFLGYSVTKRDMSSGSTSDIFKYLDSGACMVEMENWQASKFRPEYIDTVDTRGVVLNPGSIGYAGRAALFVTPGFGKKEPMSTYWKYYTNITNLNSTSLIRFGQPGQPGKVKTPKQFDSGWPSCRNTWCVKGVNSTFKGYWVPPQCKHRASSCVLAVHPVSGYDTAFFETLTKSMNMNIIHTYYGWGMAGALKNITKTGHDVLHYYWEPDPLVAALGSLRISYPDYSYGCDAKNFKNPNTGEMYCDYPGLELQKLFAVSVRDRTPEAFYALEKIKLSLEEIKGMMTFHTEAGGPMSDPFDVACSWVKKNEARIMKDFAPECISRPKKTIELKLGDKVFDAKKLTCVTVSCANDQVILNSATGVSCNTCGPGLVPNAARTNCQGCPAGETPNRATGGCAPCPKGYACRYGAETALPCEAGSYSDNIRMLECLRCKKGEYQPAAAKPSCAQCPLGMTTMVFGARKSSDCVCPAEYYKHMNATTGLYSPSTDLVMDPTRRACTPCPPGLTCIEGSDELNIPCKNGVLLRLKSSPVGTKMYPVPDVQHFTECGGAGPLSCFKCLSGTACPGNDVQVCGEGMVGLACGKCADGWYLAGEVCLQCNSVEASSVIFPLLPILIAPVAIRVFYHFSRDGVIKWNSAGNQFGAVLFINLIYIQTLAAISACYLNSPEVMTDSSDWTSYTYDLLSILRPGCTVFSEFQTAFIGKLLLPVHALVMFGFVFACSMLASLFRKNWLLDHDVLMNCYWAMFNTFFIGIAQQTFTLFQCYTHPNGDRSMRSQADVLCNGDQWNDLMAIAVVAVLIFCGGFFTLNIYISLAAPSRFQNEIFQKRWKFMFIKFRPSCWWWSLLLLSKGIWLNLPTVVFDYGAAQILWLQGCVLAYLVVAFAFLPWRSFIASTLDVGMHANLIFLFGFVTHFVDYGNSGSTELGTVYAFFSMIPLVFGVAAGMRLLYRRFKKPDGKEMQILQRTATEACATFSLCRDADTLARIMSVLPYADIMALNAAKHILDVEGLEGNLAESGKGEPKTGRLSCSGSSQSSDQLAKEKLAECGTSLVEQGHSIEQSNSSKVQKNLEEMVSLLGKRGGDEQQKNGNGPSNLHEIVKLLKHERGDELLTAQSNLQQIVDLLKDKDIDTERTRAVEVEMDRLEFPQEMMGPSLNGVVSTFSPRVLPEGRLTTKRKPLDPSTPRTATTPRQSRTPPQNTPRQGNALGSAAGITVPRNPAPLGIDSGH